MGQGIHVPFVIMLALASGQPLSAALPPETASEAAYLSEMRGPAAGMEVVSAESATWTLRYPALISARSLSTTPWADAARAFEDGRLLEAMILLDQVPGEARSAGYHVYRAHVLLLSGSSLEAGIELDRALALGPDSADAWALVSIMDVRQGRGGDALRHAMKALAADPSSAAAHLAHSYALQASRDLPAARTSTRKVIALDPENPLPQVRMAELELASGRPEQALAHASDAVRRSPGLADTHLTLGFVQLARDRAAEAATAFSAARRINPADAAAHLGLGLARIRMGEVSEGRARLEEAVALAPGSALPHAYLGRAYDLEGHGDKAAEQYALAARADPLDPIPYRFAAMRQAAADRPVTALADIRRALDRVDNRAVYRAPELLAKDHALHLADTAALEHVLGMDDKAILDAADAVLADASLGAAHLAAGDALARQARAGLASQSEYLQALLRQPIGSLPPPLALAEGIQPGAVAPQQGFFRAAVPERVGYNEFGAVFDAAGPQLDLDVILGGMDSAGDQLRVAAALGNVGFSLSHLHFETDGFSTYDGLDNGIWRGTLGIDLQPGTRLFAEYQATDGWREGLLFQRDPLFSQPQIIDEQRSRTRLALRHQFNGTAEAILLLGRQDMEQTIGNLPTATNLLLSTRHDRQAVRSDIVEAQFLHRDGDLELIAGLGYTEDDQHYGYGSAEYLFGPFPGFGYDFPVRSRNAYAYGTYRPRPDLSLVLGLAGDDQDQAGFNQRFLSPKLGLRWEARPGAFFRLAAVRALNRFSLDGASLEPAQVVGFQQFYNDGPGVRSDRVGLGWDQRLGDGWEWGFMVAGRDLRLPLLGLAQHYDRWHEREGRVWVSRVLPREFMAGGLPAWEGVLTLAYDGQDFERHGLFSGQEQIRDYRSHHVRLGGKFFRAGGLSLELGLTWVATDGARETVLGDRIDFSDSFPVADAAVAWKLPGRRGQLSLGALNLFDRKFEYIEMDPAHPRFAPERFLYAKFRLAL